MSVPEMNTSNATRMDYMFSGCSALTSVPDMNASKASKMRNMFDGCVALTDGNVKLIGKNPYADMANMIDNSGLTKLPFYDASGNWTG